MALLLVAFLGCACPRKVDINSLSDQALYQQLVAIDGIGERTALAVVVYRQMNGTIEIEALDEGVSGIGEKRLKLIQRKFSD